jgi:hypothetical protein
LTDDSQAEECEEWEDWELEVLALMTPVDLSKPIPKDRLEMVIDIEVKRQMGGWANVKRDPRWNDPYANYPMTPQAVDEYFTSTCQECNDERAVLLTLVLGIRFSARSYPSIRLVDNPTHALH